jgi:hypothetical protein
MLGSPPKSEVLGGSRQRTQIGSPLDLGYSGRPSNGSGVHCVRLTSRVLVIPDNATLGQATPPSLSYTQAHEYLQRAVNE